MAVSSFTTAVVVQGGQTILTKFGREEDLNAPTPFSPPRWFCFLRQVRYTNSATRIPEFHIEPELALELLMAANFLDC